MAKILKLLDMVVSLYDKCFRALYNAWMLFCESNEELVVTILQYAFLAGIYWIVYDRKSKNPNVKWVCRILLGMFIIYAIASRYILS